LYAWKSVLGKGQAGKGGCTELLLKARKTLAPELNFRGRWTTLDVLQVPKTPEIYRALQQYFQRAFAATQDRNHETTCRQSSQDDFVTFDFVTFDFVAFDTKEIDRWTSFTQKSTTIFCDVESLLASGVSFFRSYAGLYLFSSFPLGKILLSNCRVWLFLKLQPVILTQYMYYRQSRRLPGSRSMADLKATLATIVRYRVHCCPSRVRSQSPSKTWNSSKTWN